MNVSGRLPYLSLGSLFLLPLVLYPLSFDIALDYKVAILWSVAILVIAYLYASKVKVLRHPAKLSSLLLGIFIGSMVVSTIFSLNPLSSLVGTPLVRMGLATYLALIVLSVVGIKLITARGYLFFYIFTLVLALASILTDSHLLQIGERLSGLPHQSNVLAVCLGSGYLLGFFLPKFTHKPIALLFTQTFLLAAITLTKSRGILAILAVLTIVVFIIHLPAIRTKVIFGVKGWAMLAVATFVCLIGLGYIAGNAPKNRLFDTQLFGQSLAFRAQLQEQGVRLLGHSPPWGWGMNSLVYVYDSQGRLSPSLQQLYADGYKVGSTHNIYLDKTLELGWLGGAAFIGLIIVGLHRGHRYRHNPATAGISLILILIAAQYTFNNTLFDQEVIFWLVLMKLNFDPEVT